PRSPAPRFTIAGSVSSQRPCTILAPLEPGSSSLISRSRRRPATLGSRWSSCTSRHVSSTVRGGRRRGGSPVGNGTRTPHRSTPHASSTLLIEAAHRRTTGAPQVAALQALPVAPMGAARCAYQQAVVGRDRLG